MKKIPILFLLGSLALMTSTASAQFLTAKVGKAKPKPATSKTQSLSLADRIKHLPAYSMLSEKVRNEKLKQSTQSLLQEIEQLRGQVRDDSLQLIICELEKDCGDCAKTNADTKTEGTTDSSSGSLDLGSYLSSNLIGISISPQIFAKADYALDSAFSIRAQIFGVNSVSDSGIAEKQGEIITPEASVLGIGMQFNWSIKNLLGIRDSSGIPYPIFSIEGLFSDKKFGTSDTTKKNLTLGVLHTRLGMTLEIIEHAVELYVRYNHVLVATDAGNYYQVFGKNQSLSHDYYEVGAAVAFGKFTLDAAFALMNDNLRAFLGKPDDSIRPTIRLSFKQPVIFFN